MPTLTFTWHTHIDERTCPVCWPLNGYIWIFHITSADQFPLELRHPNQGLVWDLVADLPMTHGKFSRRGPWNCRCRVSWEINDADLQDDLTQIRQETRLLTTRLRAADRMIELLSVMLMRSD